MSPAAAKLSKDGSVHVTNERINTITHLGAACFAVLGAAVLITRASVTGDAWRITGVSIYSATLISLFVFSTLHHGYTGNPKANAILRTFDYISVFALIGGTTTPLVLVSCRNAFGWAVLGAVWAVVILGIVLRSAKPSLPKYITNTLYIVVGWMPTALVAGGLQLPLGKLLLLAIGGLAYSGGFVLFVIEKPNFRPGTFGFHELWHCLVVIAALFHYLLIYST